MNLFIEWRKENEKIVIQNGILYYLSPLESNMKSNALIPGKKDLDAPIQIKKN